MGITCFTAPPSAFKYSICACFRDVVHVSQQLCTFHKPPNNVRVQLHWGDQTRSPDIYIYYIIHTSHKQQYVVISMMGKNLWVVVLTDNCNRKII